MAIRPALRNILKVVGDLSKKDVNTNVLDTEVIQHSGGLSSADVYDYLNELESLGLIKMVKPISDKKEKDVETFKLLNITEKGLAELELELESNQQDNQKENLAIKFLSITPTCDQPYLFDHLQKGVIDSYFYTKVRIMLSQLLRGHHSVLLVDDELDIINTIRRWLQAYGFRVYAFADPLQALLYFQSNCDQIDLVLADIRMQKMNGYELVKKIKAIRPETKVIFMTALETDHQELSKELPTIRIDGFVSKPGSLEKLVSDIKKII